MVQKIRAEELQEGEENIDGVLHLGLYRSYQEGIRT